MTNKLLKTSDWKLENSYAALPDVFFAQLKPVPVISPELVILNEPLAEYLGLKSKLLKSSDGVNIFAGNKIPEGGIPLAQAYAGHQFGHFTKLGDGRAILLGEQITPRDKKYDIQLKGSGRTPYSRGGDGRASLGPMLREYIISEAMHGLNIPTTRSLALVRTGEKVYREDILPGAILTRVASSHIRVGTFQYIAQWGTVEELKILADYTIERHFPAICSAENKYLLFLQEVVEGQARLIAKWMLVGFIHGVMNTDNMLISGETIDYGPCAFMDTYHSATVFSSIDLQGRYAYENQPIIGKWNLARFAETLLPLLDENIDRAVEIAEKALVEYDNLYACNWSAGMRAKLGLFGEDATDETLIKDLLAIMEKHEEDYTNTFRSLTLGEIKATRIYDEAEFREWHKAWQTRLARQNSPQDAVQILMRKTNPAIIPRNHRVEEALEGAVVDGDLAIAHRLINALSAPFAYAAEQDEYSILPEPSLIPYQTFCGT
ncbi:MAG TPA: YdiU family protein [Syntrophomonadaceae bacterium]|nr:YdiU family protein [Syntrophomonadaceae bacterium]